MLIALLLAFAPPAALEIRHVANAGVLLRCDGEAVIVDGLYREGVAGYQVHNPAAREELETGKGPYTGVRLVLATHQHKDHFDAAAVQRFLNSNPSARAGGPPQVSSQLTGDSVRALEAGDVLAINGIDLRVYRVPHNEPHDRTIQNNVYLLTMCGTRVLITGDAIVQPQAFRDAGLAGLKPDIVVAPWWFALSDRGREILDRVMGAKAFWAVHGDVEGRAKWMSSVKERYPMAIIP